MSGSNWKIQHCCEKVGYGIMDDAGREDLGLTPREIQVVTLIGRDLKYKEIAEKLGLGYETVKTYAARIRRKLGLGSKVALALRAKEKGLIDD